MSTKQPTAEELSKLWKIVYAWKIEGLDSAKRRLTSSRNWKSTCSSTIPISISSATINHAVLPCSNGSLSPDFSSPRRFHSSRQPVVVQQPHAPLHRGKVAPAPEAVRQPARARLFTRPAN